MLPMPLETLYHAMNVLTTTAALTGTLLSVAALRHAIGNQHAATVVGNGASTIVAAGMVRQQAVIVLAQGLLLLIAVIALALPHPPLSMPSDVLQLLVTQKTIRVALSILLCTATLLDWRDRQRLEPYVRG